MSSFVHFIYTDKSDAPPIQKGYFIQEQIIVQGPKLIKLAHVKHVARYNGNHQPSIIQSTGTIHPSEADKSNFS